MTIESLKQYFKTNLETGSGIDEKLDSLIIANNSENPFDEETTKQIIKLINNLRVVDPAVGSGAFPMAMLNKLVFILGKLDPENKHWKQSQIDGVNKAVSDSVVQRKLIEQIEKQFKEKNADYGRKLYLIEKCIYGVDIQQIAVEIAKLRFFISLLVDEKIDWDNKNNYGIKPLPNLDFKLMQGNSLISTYAGIDFNDKKEKLSENALFDENEPYKKLIKKFEDLKHQYQNEADNEKKKDLRDKIDKTIITIFEEKISRHFPALQRIEENAKQIPIDEQRQHYISAEKKKLTQKLGFDIEQIEKKLIAFTEGRKEKSFFLWNVYFAEVFSEKGGFDIVIGNPPYIQLQKAISNNGVAKFADLYKNEGFETFERTGDIYALFYEKGINILTDKGLLCYITSNKWMRANYGNSLRKFFSQHNPLKLIDMGPGVFNTATVDTNILLIQKIRALVAKHKSHEYTNKTLKALTFSKNKSIDNLKENDFTTLTKLSENSWIILSPEEQKIKEKIERIGTPLKDWDIKIYRGVLTGFNEAFIIDGKTKDAFIAKDPKNAEIIKPILRGRDIKRYKAEFTDLWLIFIPWHFPLHNDNSITGSSEKAEKAFQKEYPAIYEHLLQYKDKLSKRNKAETGIRYEWYALQRCAATYYKEFEKEKIVYSEIVRQPQFYFDTEKFYVEATSFLMTGEGIKYICGLLNSKPVTYFFKKWYAGGGLGDKGYRYKKAFLKNLPIPPITKSNQNIVSQIEKLVDKILTAKKSNLEAKTSHWEKEIDQLVYKLYGLTEDEIRVVEKSG